MLTAMTATSRSEAWQVEPTDHLTREGLVQRCQLLGAKLRAEREARQVAERVALYAIARLEKVRRELVDDLEMARRTLADGQARPTISGDRER